jgi:polyisoprenoid-binding protein YceI
MKHFILSSFISLISISTFSQERVITKNASISFFSTAPLEKIEAHNKSAVSVMDKITGQVEFSVLMKGFEFEKALMQEHFNENYVESDKYPKATFKGKLDDVSKVNFLKNGTYSTVIRGKLTLHGETKDVAAPVTFTINGGTVSASCEFDVLLSDYKISIPAVVKDNIAKNVKITVKSRYQQAN